MLLSRVVGVIVSVVSLLCALVGESISRVISLLGGGDGGGGGGIVIGSVGGGGGWCRLGGGRRVPPGLRGKGGGIRGGGDIGGICTALLKLLLRLLSVSNGGRIVFLVVV